MALAIALAAVGGLIVGSFLNVVVYRLPRGESLSHPRSRCPSCGTQLRAVDNIPLVSWLALRGKCHHCGAPVSARYPLVELTTGVLYAAVVATQDDAVRIPRGMGMGDVKLAGVLGLYLGRAVAPAILIALIAGVVVGAAIIARKGAAEGRKTAVPFGPFLALGGMVAFFVGNELVDAYLDT